MSSLPVIAIVGRPNVGKSSLLNALVGKRISIVQDMPGVTRDRVSTPLKVDDRYVELIDTGGYGFHDEQGLSEHIKHQIELAMARADLVLFIVDCQEGLTGADEEIASMLRRQGIKTAIVANKCDGANADLALGDFARLGLGTPVGVSALGGRNLDQVFTTIKKNVNLRNAPKEIPAPQMMLAIVGKRNAGKSTLVNAIAQLYEDDPERVIVSEVPGTTRDSVDVRFEKDGKTLIVIDTAGVRKKRHMVTNDIEFYSFHRAERSIRRSDVVVMLIDGSEHISEPDKKLAHYVAEQFKPVILVVNKWDIVLEGANAQATERGTTFSPDLLRDEFEEYLKQELRQLDHAPVVFTTAKDARNVQVVIDRAQHLFNQANERVGTGRLNAAVKQIFDERTPSTPHGQRPKIYYATQTDVGPPTIVLFVNNPKYLTESYQRFMINRFRELLPYKEVPIRLLLRGKGERAAAATMAASASSRAEERAETKPRAKKPPSPPRRPEKPRARRAEQKSRGRRGPENKRTRR